MARRFAAHSVLIEDKGSGTQLIQELKHDRAPEVVYPTAIEPEGDKITRAVAQSAAIEAGQVLLPHQGAWLDDLRREVLQFPYGRHDDQVDSMSQFLNWERNRLKYAAHIPVIWPT